MLTLSLAASVALNLYLTREKWMPAFLASKNAVVSVVTWASSFKK